MSEQSGLTDSGESHPVDASGPPRPDTDAGADEVIGGELSLDAIEQAYQRALEISDAEHLETDAAEAGAADVVSDWNSDGQDRGMASSTAAVDTAGTLVSPADEPETGDEFLSLESGEGPTVQPRQVLEALLFVGGQPLTTRQLADALGGEFPHEEVDELIDALNHSYFVQNRPYEVRLGEGGYRLTLRSEFERVRNRVYGQGPREVRLSQDALEILAFVAYQQPVDRSAVDETGKKNAGGLLRQLLRLELVALTRDEEGNVTYHTTPRFLELFGLGSIDDLPRAAEIRFK